MTTLCNIEDDITMDMFIKTNSVNLNQFFQICKNHIFENLSTVYWFYVDIMIRQYLLTLSNQICSCRNQVMF